MKKLGELSLSQYIAKLVAISHWGAGAIFVIFGILIFISPTMLNSLTGANPMFSEIGEINSFASKATGVVGVIMIIIAIYSFLVAYGFGTYKNYARIMLLIPLYIFAGILALTGIIPSIILLFTMPVLGLISLTLIAFYGFIIFLSIYLFQKQKDMVALFKGQ
ncbi:MAG TPA: hypothetical protein PLK55_02480 [archaeon]|jgi:hypothetical protein|nr:hypothetical protein [archaeon]